MVEPGLADPRRRATFTRARPTLARTIGAVALAAVLLGRSTAQAEPTGSETPSRRGGWATLLVAYTALGAAATGGAYLLRDNFVGRSLAVTAGGWGGASLGAGAAYALTHLSPCPAFDCEEDRAVPVFLGALLGGAAGSILATWKTASPGMSRPETAAVGMTPFFLFASFGTIFDW
jgi:hypothetical protein